MLLSEVFAEFMLVDRAKSTQRTYGGFFPRFIATVGDKDITEIKSFEIDIYFKSLREQSRKFVGHPLRPEEDGSLSPATFNRNLKMVRRLFSFCVERGYLSFSPAKGTKLRNSRRQSGGAKALGSDLLLKILEVSSEAMNQTLATRDFAILLFLISTGCRRGGCASLRLENLYLNERYAIIFEKGDNEHTVYFGRETERALSAWLKVRPKVEHSFVFTSSRGHRAFTGEAIGELFKRLRHRLELPYPISPHDVRHSFGQSGADAGMPPTLVQARMGHSDVKITLEFYYNQDAKRMRHAAQNFELVALTGGQYTPPPVEADAKERLRKIINFADYQRVAK